MIGQRLVFGFKGTELPQEFTELVRKFKLGNVILFRYNVENTAQLSRLCAEIQELVRRETGHPAFITIDQEGGMVTRLPADAVNVPGSMAIAATGRVRDAYDCAGITARQLRGIGVNFNLAPDLDVNSNSMNPVIGVRSFGDDAARISPATGTRRWTPTSACPASTRVSRSWKKRSLCRSAPRSRPVFRR